MSFFQLSKDFKVWNGLQYLAISVYIAAFGPLEGAASAEEMGIMVLSSQIRYLGVGVMIVGGLWALLSLKNSFRF